MTSANFLPFVVISGLIILLNLIFCCYLTRLRRSGRGELGYKKIKYRKSRDLNETCAICLEDFKWREPIGQCPCKHAFHILCISKWLESRNTCPVCNAPPKVERPTESSYLVTI